ncbi:BTB/POZ domain family protein [Acanthocheilonema viteae]
MYGKIERLYGSEFIRFNDDSMLVAHSQILAYYSTVFFDNYRLNRHRLKIKSNAHIARTLVQFHYIGILQLPFSNIEKYFLVASKLAIDTALEALSQLLEKFSHRNDYHAIICINIACELNSHVAPSCVKSIINCAVSFLKQSISFDSYKMYANPNAMYRILQILVIFTNWKKSLQIALEWIVYEERRHLYANFILDAIIFEASDELTKVKFVIVRNEVHLLREIGQVLAEHYNHIMYQYLMQDENHVERMNPEKYSAFITEHIATSMKSSSCSEFNTTSINNQSLIWSSETENKIFDEFLLDDDFMQQIYTPNNSNSNNAKPLIPIIHSTKQQIHRNYLQTKRINICENL